MGRGGLIALMALGLCACNPGGREQRAGLAPPADAPAAPTEPAGAPAGAPAGVPVAAAVQPEELLAGALDLVGTEPFWSLKIRRDSLALDRAGQTQVLAVNPGARFEGGAAAWDAVAAASGGPLRIRLAPARCSDGMSEAVYPLAAVVEYEGRALKGCAGPPRAAAPAASAPAPR